MTFPTLFATIVPAFALTVVLFCVVGAAIGSFVALVAQRWPAGRPVIVARSVCDGCGVTLDARELVPLVSFAVQRGRCRGCGATIGWRAPLVETAAAAIGAASAAIVPWPAAAAVAGLGWTLLLLALLDLDHFWLPRAVTWPLAGAGLAATAWLRPGDLSGHVAGAAAGWASLALVAVTYKAVRGRVGLGGGDAALFAASGAWLGWAALPLVLGSAAVAGLAVALLLWGRRLTAMTRLPFGVFLAVATWAIALRSFS